MQDKYCNSQVSLLLTILLFLHFPVCVCVCVCVCVHKRDHYPTSKNSILKLSLAMCEIRQKADV